MDSEPDVSHVHKYKKVLIIYSFIYMINILKFDQLSNLSLGNLVGTYHIVFVISGFLLYLDL